MHSINTGRELSLVVALVLFGTPIGAAAGVGDTIADHFAGQPNASSSVQNADGINAMSLAAPTGVAFDRSGNLFISDYGNNRVLGYRAPLTTYQAADIVIGQPDFVSDTANDGGISASTLFHPLGLAISATGDLYVADSGNNRVLEYDRPLATDGVADVVVGQPDFVSNEENAGGIGASSLDRPSGIASDAAGDLWVADSLNNRVLEYDRPTESDGGADLVLGQPTFDSRGANTDGISARTLDLPFGVSVDVLGNVWVADTVNNRVLEFDAPRVFDSTADRVLGQPSFSSNAPNHADSIDGSGLHLPNALSVDAQGNLLVCDEGNNRVLVYGSALVGGRHQADLVFGQPDFRTATPNTGGISSRTLSSPFAIAIDPIGNIAIADSNNSRVLLFETPIPLVTSVEVKRSPRAGKRLVVRGYGMVAGDAIVEVDGQALASTTYRDVAVDGSARRLLSTDADFAIRLPRGVPVRVTVVNSTTGSRSATILFAR